MSGKVALVTGAASASGLGFNIALSLAREGVRVVLTDVDGFEALTRAAEICAEEGAEALGLPHDVTSEADWERALDATLARFGQVDVLVNNAGITIQNGIEQLDLAFWNKVVSVNQTGTFLGCKHAMIAMRRASRGGSIINISSVAAIMGVPSSSAYSASKSAVRQLSKVAALEGADSGIRCNTVLPGMISTGIHANIVDQYPEMHAQIVALIPMKRMGDPMDIAAAVVFLASDEARYVTGAEIVVDGGLTVP